MIPYPKRFFALVALTASIGLAGCINAELPGGGWPTAALTEILPQHAGIGELRILGHALANLAAQGRWLAWIAPPYLPYAPALQAAGIDLSRLLVIRTRTPRETLWAVEQTLRSQTCGAVLAWPDKIAYAELRRLQLAAEGSNTLAVLFRSQRCITEATPAALRLRLDSTQLPRAFQVSAVGSRDWIISSDWHRWTVSP